MNNKNSYCRLDIPNFSRHLFSLTLSVFFLSFFSLPVYAQPYVYEALPDTTIIDKACVTSTINVPEAFSVNDLKVGVNLTHTYRSDLSITLASPLGNSVQLYAKQGSSSDNLDILLDDAAPGSVSNIGTSPHNVAAPYYENSFRPVTSLSNFDGLPARGSWVLKVCDAYNADGGTVYRFKLDFDGTAGAGSSGPTTLYGNGPRSFIERETVEFKGNFEYVGNTLLHCVSGCTTNNHNASPMSYVDIDGDAATFNSSSADISLPDNAEVTWAGLYWGGTAGINTSSWSGIIATPNVSKKQELKFKVPGGAYKKLTANQIDTIANDPTSGWSTYQAYADVTDLVKASGEGRYTVADVQLDRGGGYNSSFTGPNGGWNLVVIYKSETEQYRHITIWDGFDFIYFSDANNNFTVNSIRTPPSGAFETEVAFMCFDGEQHTTYGSGTGDFLAIGNTSQKLTNGSNPSTNVCNGSISKSGNNVTTRNPSYTQNWAFDVDRFTSNTMVPNNANSVTAIFGSDNEGIWFGNLVLSTELFIPPQATKSFTSAILPATTPSDMTITLSNPNISGSLENVAFSDTYPVGLSNATTGVIKSNSCGGSLTAAPNAGSLSFSGGSLSAGESCTLVVSVVVAESTIGSTLENCTSEITSSSTDSKGESACASAEIASASATTLDFGDAPESYGDASHIVVSGLYLGLTAPDTEEDSQHSFNAFGDGEQIVDGAGTWYLSGDEDGAPSQPVLANGTYIPLFPVLKMTAMDYSTAFTVTNTTGSNAKLHGWIDFDGNGSFDADESAVTTVAHGTTTGQVTLNWDVPTDIALGTTFIRLRLTTDSSVSASNPAGGASDGEVEDFTLAVAMDIPPDSDNIEVISGEAPLSCQQTIFEDDFDDLSSRNNQFISPNRGAGGGTKVNLRNWQVTGGGSDTYARVQDVSGLNMGSAIYLGNGAVRRIIPAIGSALGFDASGRLTSTIDAIELRDGADDTSPGVTSLSLGTESDWGPLPVRMSRSFATETGKTYRLYFKAIPEGTGNDFVPGTMRVDAPGGIVHFKTPASNEGVIQYAIEFTAVAATSTISFVNYGHLNLASNGWCDPASEYNNNAWCTVGGGTVSANELILDDIKLVHAECGVGGISGTVFTDAADDGQYDADSDSGLANISVTLYDDKQTESTSDDSLIATATSDAQGGYLFDGVSIEGSYRVEADANDNDLPDRFKSTTTNPLTGLTVALNTVNENNNFGFAIPTGSCPAGEKGISQQGWATQVELDQGVANEKLALGHTLTVNATTSNSNSALLSANDVLVLDLGELVPGYMPLTVSLARHGSNGRVEIATSADNTDFETLGTFGSGGTLGAGSQRQANHLELEVPVAGARYVRFTRKAGSIWIDGVAYDSVCAPSKDTDGDGVVDIVDLDDDNDGILDANEGRQCIPDFSNAEVGKFDQQYWDLGSAQNIGQKPPLSRYWNAVDEYGLPSLTQAPTLTGRVTAPGGELKDVSRLEAIKNEALIHFPPGLDGKVIQFRAYARFAQASTWTISTSSDPSRFIDPYVVWQSSEHRNKYSQYNGQGFYLFDMEAGGPRGGNAWPARGPAEVVDGVFYPDMEAYSIRDFKVDANEFYYFASYVSDGNHSYSVPVAQYSVDDGKTWTNIPAANYLAGVTFDCVSIDTDNDGITDDLDLDSDNDGIPDNIEAQATLAYIAPSHAVSANITDIDGDGLDDAYDHDTSDSSKAASVGLLAVDTDDDRIFDYRDTDSDGTETNDTDEAGLVLSSLADADKDGLFDIVDTDDNRWGPVNAGITDVYNSYPNDDISEVDWRISKPKDTDEDGIPDTIDIDDDNDGVLDSVENSCSETGFASGDLSWHGTAAGNVSSPDDTTLDVSGRAWANAYSDQSFSLPVTIEGTIVSAVNGMLGIIPVAANETSSWNDGGYKFQFNRGSGMYVRHGSATSGWHSPSMVNKTFRLDIDGAGKMDYWHDGRVVYTGNIPLGSYKLTLSRGAFKIDNFSVSSLASSNGAACDSLTEDGSTDTDGDGLADSLDLDSDDDGIPDNIEAQTTAGYIAPSHPVSANITDIDGDGLDDAYDLNTSDTSEAASVGLIPVDTEEDTLRDFQDTDSDNTETDDTSEAGLDLGNLDDSDSDGLVDSVDTDDVAWGPVNAGITDVFNAYPNDDFDEVDWRKTETTDTDKDGVPDERDIDDDNDGILDKVENSCSLTSVLPGDLSWHGTAAGNVSSPESTTLNVSGSAWANAYSDQSFSLPFTIEGTITSAANGMLGIIPVSANESSSWNDGGYKFQFNSGNGMYVRHGAAASGWHTPSIVNRPFKLDIDGSGKMDYWHNGSIVYTANVPQGSYKLTLSRGAFKIDDMSISSLSSVNGSTCDSLTEDGATDTDGDGLADSLDLDADGDGIPDNIEAQTSTGYQKPSGVDADKDGLDDIYDNDTSDNSAESSGGLTPVNTDTTDAADYVDLDSDNDGSFDIVESGFGLVDSDNDGRTEGQVGVNGWDSQVESGDDYADPNGQINDPANKTDGNLHLLDRDNDVAGNQPLIEDLDYRDVVTPRDFGDAPASYGEAAHYLSRNLEHYLGSVPPDAENRAQHTGNGGVDGQGDDLSGDDEEGVVFADLNQGGDTSIEVDAVGNGGFLQAWIDWNADGDFTDPGEQIAINEQDHNNDDKIFLNLVVPENAVAGLTYARFRWSTTQGVDSRGAASDGEVEDYKITIHPAVTIDCGVESQGSGSGYATGGAGAFRPDIFWLDWSCNGITRFEPDDIVTKSWSVGNGMEIHARIDNITATISPYNTGQWVGDVLDELYSGVNPIGLSNYNYGADPTYDIHLSATLDGVAIPADIVVAEAEDTDGAEYAIWTTDGDPWEPIETWGILEAKFSNGGRTVAMRERAIAGGGTLLAMTENVSKVSVDMGAGGKEALAFGVFSSFDYGDLGDGYPQSKGHYARLDAAGGSRPTGYTSVKNLTLATLTPLSTHYLGSIPADANNGDVNSVNADGDDTSGVDDEDGIYISKLVQGKTANLIAAVRGQGGYLQGWIDWNGDGDFSDTIEGISEQIIVNAQDNISSVSGQTDDDDSMAGQISVGLTVPNNTASRIYARFRWSTSKSLNTTAVADDGEIEDYVYDITQISTTCSPGKVFVPISLIDFGAGTDNSLPISEVVPGAYSSYNVAPNLNRPTNGDYVVTNAFGLWGMAGKQDHTPFDLNGRWFQSSLGLNGGGDNNNIIAGLPVGNAPTDEVIQLNFWAISRTGSPPVMKLRVRDSRNSVIHEESLSVGQPANWTEFRTAFYLPSGHSGLKFELVNTRPETGGNDIAIDDIGFGYCGQAPVYDFGDAPDTGSGTSVGNYHSLKSDSGAVHQQSNSRVYLGGSVGDEADAQVVGGDASGDSGDDGVTLGGISLQGKELSSGENYVLGINTRGSGYLNAWIDWNRDGDFDDIVGGISEQIAKDLAPVGGRININVEPPASLVMGSSYARFRFSSQSGLRTTGLALDGEVEDYQVLLQSAKPFVCGSDLYQVISKRLHKYNLGTGQYEPIGTPVNFEYSMGYRESDDLLYGIVTGDRGGADSYGESVAVGDIIRVDADGLIGRVSGTNTPGNNHNAADIHQGRGTLWIRNGNNKTLSEVNINTGTILQTITLTGSAAINGEIVIVEDTAYRWLDGNLHRIQLPVSGGGTVSAASVPISGVNASMSGAGAAFGFDDPDNPGTTVLYWPEEGTGDLYKITGIDSANPKAVKVADTPSSSENDGASCPSGIAPFRAFTISGNIFEDLTYGGGAGRAFGANGTVGLSDAVVEIYDAGGNLVQKVVTETDGSYQFTNISNGDYYLRAVSSTVNSSRSGSDGREVPVMTYRGSGVSGVTNEVGGRHPELADAEENTGNSRLNTSTFKFSSGRLSRKPAQAIQPVTIAGGYVDYADFGFNFNTVVNTNAEGQGSLQQFVLNSNKLSSDGIGQTLPATVAGDYSTGDTVAVFMIPLNQLDSRGNAEIEATSTLDIERGRTVIDGRLQAINMGRGNIIYENKHRGRKDGIKFSENSDGSVLRNLTIKDFKGNGIVLKGAGSNPVQGVRIEQVQVTNNSRYGIYLEKDAVDNKLIANVITGNDQAGIANKADANNTFSQNSISSNDGLGIDLGADGVTGNSRTDSWLNYPDLNSKSSIGSNGTRVVSYDFDLDVPVNAYGYRVEFFSNNNVDSSGHGEGLTYLGYADIVASVNGTENFKGSINANQAVPEDANIAVTLTEITGSGSLGATSEFSAIRNGRLAICTVAVTDPDAPKSEVILDIDLDDITYLEALDENGDPITYIIRGSTGGDSFEVDPVPDDALFDCDDVEFGNEGEIIGNRILAVNTTDISDESMSGQETVIVNGVGFRAKALLQGAYNPETGLMSDLLRIKGVLPVDQPYNNAPYYYTGTETITSELASIEGKGAIVDWVVLELSSMDQPATPVARKAALITRDGGIIDAVNGSSDLVFESVPEGEYLVSVGHRNHLKVKTLRPYNLSAQANIRIDFSLPETEVSGDYARYLDSESAAALLWSGDINHDQRLILDGEGSDLNLILQDTLTAPDNIAFNSSYQAGGYLDSDLNMDGVTLFMGPDNDANILLGNILIHPANDELVDNFVIMGGGSLQ